MAPAKTTTRRSGLTRFAFLVGLALVVMQPAGAASNQNRLEDVEVASLPGERVQLRLRLSDTAPEPLSFTVDNPARIALDLPDTRMALEDRRQEIGVGSVRSVAAAEAQGKTRVVINLSSMVPFDTRREGNSLYVTLGDSQEGQVSRQSRPFSDEAEAVVDEDEIQRVTNIDFRRGEEGQGRVLVRLSDPDVPINVEEQGEQIVINVRNAELPQSLERRMDVLDFATPVKSVDAEQRNSDVRITVRATGEFDQLAYQSDTLFAVELKPLTEEEQEERQKETFSGERLTLNFQDIETRAVLQIIADFTGLNMVVSDTVSGNVTLRLQNVPWDQALDIILKTKGLDMRRNGNAILVAPAQEIAQREQQELEAEQSKKELAPLRSEFIQVNYAKASEIAGLLKSEKNTFLSERGNVSVDDRTNALLVHDTDARLADVRELVNRIDVPVRQVLIESRVVVANNDFTDELGIKFGGTATRDRSNNGLISTTGTATGNDVIMGSALDNIQNSGQPYPVEVPSLNDRLNVNLPVSSPSGRFALAILGSDYLVDLEISAAQSEGRGELVSSPRLITANQQEASIKQGVEIPYQTLQSGGGGGGGGAGSVTTQFKEAVLSLQVTPQITPDDRIIMDLEVHRDSVGEEVPSATGGFVPSIDKRELITQVLVNNGETVVLGGIYETEVREIRSKVPVLGDIPGLGVLFRNRRDVANKAELLIFVTPKILKEGTKLQ